LNQPTPAIVAQSAVRRLPRIALLLLCAVYLLPGLVGRGPWKSADITAFGYMAELAQSAASLAHWLNPTLLGMPAEIPGPLPYWIGALVIRAVPGWVDPDLAVRAIFALLLGLTFTATWFATYYLARMPQAQSVAFAFGGEARPKDYARAIGDGGLLALIACLGLAQLGHETTPALAQLFFCANLFYGVSALPYHRRIMPRIGCTVGVVGMALSGAPAMSLALGAGATLLAAVERGLRQRAERAAAQNVYAPVHNLGPTYSSAAILWLAGSTALAAVLAAALGLLQWHVTLLGTGHASLFVNVRNWIKLLIWFTWPVWPLALWTLWRWRRHLGQRHVALPLWFVAVPLAATLTTSFADRSLLLALPALAVLAAFALPTFRRSAAALVDWFTLLFFSGAAVFIWAYWIAMQTGIPPRMAASVPRLLPGYVPSLSWTALLLALAATLAWGWLVRWRTGHNRPALWKTLVLPAGGAALCWALLMTLWLSALNYARSYAPQVQAVIEHVGQPVCVNELALSPAHVAALRFHGGLNLVALDTDKKCPWLLVTPVVITQLHDIINLEYWRLIGTLRRPASDTDDLLLYQYTGPK
jgi:4-amino-4-deoxy-L-arabinose transferase-like glycosyltransferase